MSTTPHTKPPAWPLLPLIRVLPDYTSVAKDPFDDVLGIYNDALVFFRKRRGIEVPMEAGEDGGAEVLMSVKSQDKKRIVAWQGIESVLVSKPITRGSRLVGEMTKGYELHFHFSDGEVRPLFFPNRAADHVIAAIRERIPERVREKVDPLPPVRLRTRRRPFFFIVGLLPIPIVFFLFLLVLLPLLVVNVVRLCIWKLRRRVERSIAGSLIKLTLISVGPIVVYSGLFFRSAGTTAHRTPEFTQLVLFLGLMLLLVCGGLMSSWIAGQMNGVLATQVLATHDVIPGPPEWKLNWWKRLLQPFRRFLQSQPLSIACKTLGIITYIFATVLIVYPMPKAPPTNPIDAVDAELSKLFEIIRPYLGLLAYVPATALIYVGYRLGLRSADTALSRSVGAPAIYLRSFTDDGRNDFNPTGFLASSLGLRSAEFLSFFGPLANANPIRLLRLCVSTNADTAEEQLSQYFRKKGPFVAIGRPGELLVPGGAARAYLTHEQWQDRVHEWLAKAGTVVVQPATTPGVWWEIEEALRTVPKEKLLFCLVNYQRDQHGYEQFASRFEQIAGVRMPRHLGNRCFLWLEGDQAQLTAPILRWPLGWPISGCAVDFQKTLQPFLTPGSVQSDHADKLRQDSSLWAVNGLVAIILWFCVAAIPGLVIGTIFDEAWGRHKTQKLARNSATSTGTWGQPAIQRNTLEELAVNAATEARNTEFVDYNEKGYRWRLRRAWQLTNEVAGSMWFTLRDMAKVCVIPTPAFASDPTSDQLTNLNHWMIRQLEINHGSASRELGRSVITLNGHRWLETVFEIESKTRPGMLHYIQRVTVNEHQGLVAEAWTRNLMARDLDATLREALDNLTPTQSGALLIPNSNQGTTGSSNALRSYNWILDPHWKETFASGKAKQIFTNDSGARAVVIVRNVSGLPADYASYVTQFLKNFERGFEILSNEACRHQGREAWRVLLKHTNGQNTKYVICLFILENGTLFQVIGDTIPPRSDFRLIVDALEKFQVNTTEPSSQP